MGCAVELLYDERFILLFIYSHIYFWDYQMCCAVMLLCATRLPLAKVPTLPRNGCNSL